MTNLRRLLLIGPAVLATLLSAAQDAWSSSPPSHVVVLDQAIESKAARLTKIINARETIDAQYFTVEQDEISTSALALLRDAAIRGLKVRVIIDSMHNEVSKGMMTALMYNLPAQAKGRIEVRVFNPFNILHPFCYTRRMHDKSLIIDGQTLIAGDKNVGNGYFDMPAKGKNGMPAPIYQGLDVMVTGGQAVADAKTYFEQRWKSRDVQRIYENGAEELDPAFCAYKAQDNSLPCELSQSLHLDKVRTSTAALDAAMARMQGPAYQQLMSDAEASWQEQGFASESVEFIHDSVTDKKLCKGKSRQNNIGTRLYKAILENTQDKLLIVTPYLTVTPKMEQLIRDLKAKNPQISIRFLTNSQKSNDVPSAHAGYLATRKKLIDAGVKIYEFQRVNTEYGTIETLHAKAVLMDSKKAFIGSYNWDFRSEQLNSEIGVIIDLADHKSLRATQDIRSRIAELVSNSIGLDTNGGGVAGTGSALDGNLSELTQEELNEVLMLEQYRARSLKKWNKLLKIPLIGDLLLKQL